MAVLEGELSRDIAAVCTQRRVRSGEKEGRGLNVELHESHFDEVGNNCFSPAWFLSFLSPNK